MPQSTQALYERFLVDLTTVQAGAREQYKILIMTQVLLSPRSRAQVRSRFIVL